MDRKVTTYFGGLQMKSHTKNVLGLVKEHRKEIVIVGVISILSAIGGAAIYKQFNCSNVYLPTLDISPGDVRYHGGGMQVAIYDDPFPLVAMGKLGERIVESIPNLPDNPVVVYADLVLGK